eukprot:superscaffoldBa00007290_g22396
MYFGTGFLQTVGEISTFWRSTLMETTLDADMEMTHYKSVTPAHHHLFSACHHNEGAYVVQLVMEDFPRETINLIQTSGSQEVKTTSNAISKIPVQFALKVDPVVPSCTEGLYLPKFLPPTPANRVQLHTSVNQTLEISIHAEANNST